MTPLSLPGRHAVSEAVSPLAVEPAFPGLSARLPRFPLTALPTRVHRLERLAAGAGTGELWVKRDDESGPLYGGNKPRKLEFLLGAALSAGRRTVLTTGGIGTHHGLATAVCARAAGLRTILLLLKQPVSAQVRRSLLLDLAAGAEMHYAPTVPRLALCGVGVLLRELLRGEIPYVIPTGGTSPLGTIGFVNAAFELREQIAAGELPEPDWIFVPLGSGGTVAGLVLGAKLAGLRSRVAAVLVTDILPPSPARLARLAARTLARLRACAPGPEIVPPAPEDFRILSGFVGAGYGVRTQAAAEARELMREREGIELETTYTAKCLAALLDALRRGEFAGAKVLFWNTYSSVDPARHLGELPDFHALPRPFHGFFAGAAE